MQLSILNDSARIATDKHFGRFAAEHVSERVRKIDAQARKSGLDSLSAATDEIVALGMEISPEGRVTKNSLGLLNLSWQAAEHPEWAQNIADEVAAIREAIRHAHGTNIRFVIWAGMGGSIEDKTAYNAMGLLKGGPRFYSLDSTDPNKLKAIVDDMQQRAQEPIAKLLPATLVVGMAMGMTSYEPVVNLEKLAYLYDRFGIASQANFVYMTYPDSTLDRFAGPRGYRRIPLQPDLANTTAGRHSAPLTRGSLYPLALAGRDLRDWISGAFLTGEDEAQAYHLASFLHAQGEAGRDKITLFLPAAWSAVGLWTKQNFEESLGKSETLGLKIVIGERFNGRTYRKPSDPRQDRLFLAVQRKGEAHPDAAGITSLRGAGYPMAVLTFSSKAPLSHYMQFVHYVVFALGYLRRMNFVTQPSVELYKSMALSIHGEAQQLGDVKLTQAWKPLSAGKTWRQAISPETPESLAAAIRQAAERRRFSYGELTFFGDMRYAEEGRKMRRALETAGQRLFRVKLKMPVDIYEGPAMNHSYHEMIIGRGDCFSIVILAEEQGRFPTAKYEADYHVAQFLATRLALESRRRLVRAILVKDLSTESIAALEEFFTATAALLDIQ